MKCEVRRRKFKGKLNDNKLNIHTVRLKRKSSESINNLVENCNYILNGNNCEGEDTLLHSVNNRAWNIITTIMHRLYLRAKEI
jgi:hypothetical protein